MKKHPEHSLMEEEQEPDYSNPDRETLGGDEETWVIDPEHCQFIEETHPAYKARCAMDDPGEC